MDMQLLPWDPYVAELGTQVTSRRFNNFIEPDDVPLILDKSPVAEAKLLRKYKAIRFYDDDADPELHYRVRCDRLTWKGKKSGGWVLNCDKMAPDDPASDPGVDIEIYEVYPEPCTYFIIDELHRMISMARQAAGILLVSNAEATDEESE